MNPKKHAQLTNIYGYAFPISLIALLFMMLLSNFDNYIIVLFMLFMLSYVILRYLPVNCNKPGCHGRMMLTRSRIGTNIVENIYKCQDCGKIYQAKTYWPTSRDRRVK
jgi:hypothetical protein